MAKVKLNEGVTLNGVVYTSGDILNVSSSIFKDLVEVKKCAELYTEESSIADVKKAKK